MNKHEFLSASLPYKLNLQMLDKKHFYELRGLIDLHCQLKGNDDRIIHCSISWATPIIRQFDLYKQIQHNGKIFIPITELARIAYPDDKVTFKKNTVTIIRNKYGYEQRNSFRFYNGHFICRLGSGDFNRFQLFLKLIEWHFWIDMPENEDVIYVTDNFNPYK